MKPRLLTALLTLTCLLGFATLASAAENTPASPPAHQPSPAPAEQSQTPAKPAARKEDTEPQTLPAALAELKTARGDRDAAEAALLAEQGLHEKTKGLLKSTLETAQSATKDRDTAQASVESLTKERDAENAAHGKTKEMLDLAEAALLVKGVPAAKAVAAETAQSAGEGEREALVATLNAATDPAKRGQAAQALRAFDLVAKK